MVAVLGWFVFWVILAVSVPVQLVGRIKGTAIKLIASVAMIAVLVVSLVKG